MPYTVPYMMSHPAICLVCRLDQTTRGFNVHRPPLPSPSTDDDWYLCPAILSPRHTRQTTSREVNTSAQPHNRTTARIRAYPVTNKLRWIDSRQCAVRPACPAY
ncbi:hypothetical protein BGZ61DRAFT_444838 [Ilyonectria robusta]|uniref:uncharacterized protein n=1 Tax=Ilyonectria robusta TaxID=1079257 RepID=UPI001E8DE928|nr:uncharacterized protein BGZ61DRAFT_444838 [Ilyonectria robusta]KAH8733554.1 hypothetical protein BGZ61DRAFT_444838 [Ilyonectria robusta]